MDHDKSILIVEDDDDVREALAAFLEGEGYPVVEARDGQEALRCLRSTTEFCLILLDLFMPVMNGWSFRREQLNDAKLASIPVVVISADRSAPERAIDLGAVEAMVKPIHFDRLRATVGLHC
jgi:CheY-like chemotaxis protein